MGRKRLTDKRICYACGTDKNHHGQANQSNWVRNQPTNLFLCRNCAAKYIYYPKTPKSKHKIRNAKRLRFGKERLHLKFNPRKGVCQCCGKSEGKTNMHHIKYHEDDPLKDTIELCDSCHRQKHSRPFYFNRWIGKWISLL